jgi:hypothetical protein
MVRQRLIDVAYATVLVIGVNETALAFGVARRCKMRAWYATATTAAVWTVQASQMERQRLIDVANAVCLGLHVRVIAVASGVAQRCETGVPCAMATIVAALTAMAFLSAPRSWTAARLVCSRETPASGTAQGSGEEPRWKTYAEFATAMDRAVWTVLV